MTARHTRIVERVQSRLKFNQLKLIIAVGKHSNIRNAARELNISQPAATKIIKDMEIDFEVKLFDRTNRGVVPTVFGEALIRHGKLIFSQVANAAQELHDLSEGNSGRVVVGTLLAASPQLLPLAIEKLTERRPRVAIKIIEGTNEALMPNLRAGEIDMIVGRLPVHRHRDEIVQEKLLDEQILAVVGPQHPLAKARIQTFDQLKSLGWIIPPIETSLRRQLDQFFISQGSFAPNFSLESVSYLANRSLLQSHDLISLMPSQVPAYDIRNGNLCALNWTVPFGSGPVGVSYHRKAEISPAGKSLLNALKEAASGI